MIKITIIAFVLVLMFFFLRNTSQSYQATFTRLYHLSMEKTVASLLDSVPDVILIADEEGIIYFNNEARKLLNIVNLGES